VICKAPFHDRFYDMFNLQKYKPPSWEHNEDNTPELDHEKMWGKDLLWNWRQGVHSVYKSHVSSQLNWETDPTEVVNVAEKLCGRGRPHMGRRMFFFQCLGGYLEEGTNTFRYGQHPKGHKWNADGRRITNEDGIATMDDMERIMYDESEWGPRYNSQALDFVMEQHSPHTKHILNQLRRSNILQEVLEAKGPATRTRAERKLVEVIGHESSGAGPSGTSNNPHTVE